MTVNHSKTRSSEDLNMCLNVIFNGFDSLQSTKVNMFGSTATISTDKEASSVHKVMKSISLHLRDKSNINQILCTL